MKRIIFYAIALILAIILMFELTPYVSSEEFDQPFNSEVLQNEEPLNEVEAIDIEERLDEVEPVGEVEPIDELE